MEMEEIRELITKCNQEPLKDDMNVSNIIKEQYKKNKETIAGEENFIKATKDITERAVYAQLEDDALKVLSQEQKNELAKYIFNLNKDMLDYRKKKEKQIVLEEIKSELQNKKIEALKKRFGYLYKENEPFIPSKFHNIQKEIVNRWESTSINTKKIIKGVLRILFYGGIAVIIAVVGSNIIKWVLDNADKLSMLK